MTVVRTAVTTALALCTRVSLALGVLVCLALAGCGGSSGESGGGRDAAQDMVDPAPAAFPTLAEVYAGPQGVYRGCGPNGGVCHNGREYPNLATLGSIVGNVGKPCNEKRDDPTTIHDLCERAGDTLEVGSGRAEIGSVSTADPEKLRWKVRLAAEIAPQPAAAKVKVLRALDRTLVEIYDLSPALSAKRDATDGRTVWLTIETPDRNEATFLQTWFGKAGVLGDPGSLQVGDPNRNGVFGATIGGSLIKPGDPGKSYLFARLLDPEAGPVMPRANCCHWSKSSLRALWCWVAGLAPGGKNAMDPIGYENCPPLPKSADDILYPEPGPACETSGGCPVRPRMSWPDGAPATFGNVYKYVLAQSCGGAGSCHDAAQPGAGLSMRTESDAYRDLVGGEKPRVVPGNPAGSLLVRRISPAQCAAPTCITMPLGRPSLDKKLRDQIASWIENGAKP